MLTEGIKEEMNKVRVAVPESNVSTKKYFLSGDRNAHYLLYQVDQEFMTQGQNGIWWSYYKDT